MLGYYLLMPIMWVVQLRRTIDQRRDRAHRAWLAERAAYLEAGWDSEA